MADTRSARKTSTPRTAKKTAAKKAAAGRAPRKPAAKKTTAAPRLSLVKAEPARSEDTTRRRDFVTDAQIYATHTARIAGIPIHRIRDWRDHRNNTATRPLRDGSLLHYDHNTRTLTWRATCPMGAVHVYKLTSPSTAAAARVHADRCTTPHADFGHIPKMTRDELEALGVHTGPTWARPDQLAGQITETIPVSPAAVTRAKASAADTQPLSRTEIAAGLAARADNDTPKEHPNHA